MNRHSRGGVEEKILRAAKVVDLTDRELTPTEALGVFTKAKVRYRIGVSPTCRFLLFGPIRAFTT